MESLYKVLEVVNTFVTLSHVQRDRHDLVTIQCLGTGNLCLIAARQMAKFF